MIILLHGDNTVGIHEKLTKMRQEFSGESTDVDAKTLTPESFAQLLTGNSLFSSSRLIFVENCLELLTKKFPFNDRGDCQLVLWEDKQLSAAQIRDLAKLFPDLIVEELKINPVVFRFLEALRPSGQKQFMPLWRSYLQTDLPEVAAVMLARQIRFLLLSKLGTKSGPDDFQHLAPWQMTRLKQQAALFDLPKLEQFLEQLLQIDFSLKTGLSATDMQTSLELLLLSL